MARPKAKAPARRYHISGQSVVTLDGKDFYLGPHDSPEAMARYAVLIREYQANGLRLPAGFDLSQTDAAIAAILQADTAPSREATKPRRVSDVTACFREKRIATRYADSPQEHHRLTRICDELDEHYGDHLAEDFGPLALQEQRQRWVDAGVSRTYANRLTSIVRRIFRFAVSQEVIKKEQLPALDTVEPLRFGEAKKETTAVVPVPIEHVRQTAKHLSPTLRAMIRVQVATGMRPSEVCNMRPCDIDRSGEAWFYRPPHHKLKHKGKSKAVPLVGDAREAIEDYLNRPGESYCFSPVESLAWYRAKQRSARKSKVPPSQESRRKPNPAKAPRERFDAHSYRQSLQRAAKRAGVPHWHPYQLRHLAASVIRGALDIEGAQAMLGHTRIGMTEHYARLSEAKALEAAKVAPKL